MMSGGGRRKGPAPGLPLPERREVKLQMSPQELQVQLDLLESQQLGLERQGVHIEQLIRDKCEGEPYCLVLRAWAYMFFSMGTVSLYYKSQIFTV